MSDEKTFSKKVPVESPLLSLQNNFKDRQALLIHWIREGQGIPPWFHPWENRLPSRAADQFSNFLRADLFPNRSTIGTHPLTTVENQKCHFLRTRSFPTHWKTANIKRQQEYCERVQTSQDSKRCRWGTLEQEKSLNYKPKYWFYWSFDYNSYLK